MENGDLEETGEQHFGPFVPTFIHNNGASPSYISGTIPASSTLTLSHEQLIGDIKISTGNYHMQATTTDIKPDLSRFIC